MRPGNRLSASRSRSIRATRNTSTPSSRTPITNRVSWRSTTVWSGVFSAVSAGTGVALTSDVFDYAFNDRVKLVHLTPEPKRIAIGLITRKGKLSPPTERFCQCAKEAFASGALR
jgi:DNA-binding transcriptional LysR family regulator